MYNCTMLEFQNIQIKAARISGNKSTLTEHLCHSGAPHKVVESLHVCPNPLVKGQAKEN